MPLHSSVQLSYCTEVSFFDTVADNIDAFVPCWHETLYNPCSATRGDVLNSAAVQLQCDRYVSKCDPSVFQSHSTHSACLHILAGCHGRGCPFDCFRTLHRLMTCRLLFMSPSYTFINWRRIKLAGKYFAHRIRISLKIVLEPIF